MNRPGLVWIKKPDDNVAHLERRGDMSQFHTTVCGLQPEWGWVILAVDQPWNEIEQLAREQGYVGCARCAGEQKSKDEEVIITEIDGVPAYCMTLIDGSNVVRFIYRCMYFEADSEAEANKALENAQDTVRIELKKVADELHLKRVVLIWRRRPERAMYFKQEKRWRSSMRFATSPLLSEEAWARIGWETPTPGDEFTTHINVRA